MLYEGISRPWRLATLTILILLALVSLGILLIMSPFSCAKISTRLLYIFSHPPSRKRATPGNDNHHYKFYQHHRSRFDRSTGVIFTKMHQSSRIETQQSIYDGHRYLHRICSSHRCIQYIVHGDGNY